MIKRKLFDKRFRQLVYETKRRLPGSAISFRSGLWFDEEGYKLAFRKEAREKLELDKWDQLTDKEIVSRATQPFGVLIDGS